MQKWEEWNNPYPRWVKTHTKTARDWVIIAAILITLGLIYAYVRVLILGPYSGNFRHFPEMNAVYPVALETAKEANPKAQLAMIEIMGRRNYDFQERFDPALDYKTEFYFCSPEEDGWGLQVEVRKVKRGIFRTGYDIRTRGPSNQFKEYLSANCIEHLIHEVPENTKKIVEYIRENIPYGTLSLIEPVPHVLWMKSERDIGNYWGALFKYRHADLAYGILLDSSGNVLKEAGEVGYLYEWQLHDLGDYP